MLLIFISSLSPAHHRALVRPSDAEAFAASTRSLPSPTPPGVRPSPDRERLPVPRPVAYVFPSCPEAMSAFSMSSSAGVALRPASGLRPLRRPTGSRAAQPTARRLVVAAMPGPAPRPLSGAPLPGSAPARRLVELSPPQSNIDSERAGREFRERLARGQDVAKVSPSSPPPLPCQHTSLHPRSPYFASSTFG